MTLIDSQCLENIAGAAARPIDPDPPVDRPTIVPPFRPTRDGTDLPT